MYVRIPSVEKPQLAMDRTASASANHANGPLRLRYPHAHPPSVQLTHFIYRASAMERPSAFGERGCYLVLYSFPSGFLFIFIPFPLLSFHPIPSFFVDPRWLQPGCLFFLSSHSRWAPPLPTCSTCTMRAPQHRQDSRRAAPQTRARCSSSASRSRPTTPNSSRGSWTSALQAVKTTASSSPKLRYVVARRHHSLSRSQS